MAQCVLNIRSRSCHCDNNIFEHIVEIIIKRRTDLTLKPFLFKANNCIVFCNFWNWIKMSIFLNNFRVNNLVPFFLIKGIVLNFKAVTLTRKQKVKKPLAYIRSVILKERFEIFGIGIRIAHKAFITKHPCKLFFIINLTERKRCNVQIHSSVVHIFIIIIHKEDNRLLSDWIIEKYRWIVCNKCICAIQKAIVINTLWERLDMLIIAKRNWILQNRMEIDKENLVITKLIINNLKYFLNLAFIRSGVDIVVACASPSRHISINGLSR